MRSATMDNFKVVLDFLKDDNLENNLPTVDALFVFGHVDPRVAIHAVELYKLGKANKIIISGKGRKVISNFDTEADFYASIMDRMGIFQDHLILERKATNTLENVLFGIRAAEDHNFYPKSLISVAMSPLLRRSRATFNKQFSGIEIYNSSPNISLSEFSNHTARILEEFDRLEEYSKKGDIEPVEIPEKIKRAVACLKLQIKGV
jgi:uncharacterized SAM-binding protein YcdF (DUF218 family)